MFLSVLNGTCSVCELGHLVPSVGLSVKVSVSALSSSELIWDELQDEG